jgi:hypothetical protein
MIKTHIGTSSGTSTAVDSPMTAEREAQLMVIGFDWVVRGTGFFGALFFGTRVRPYLAY